MVGVVIPSYYEAKLFFKRLENRISFCLGKPCGYKGKIDDADVIGCLIRIGMPIAAESTQQLIDEFKIDKLILAGFAGGLDPSLKRGDLLHVPSDEISTAIYTGAEVVATVADKKALWEQTGCRIVDMESGPVAEVASSNDIPFSVIRVVSDDANEAVPVDILDYGYNREKGRETPVRMGLRLATHPKEIFEVKRFLEKTGPCRSILADAIEAVISG
ncbi:hypothetical protein [Rubellicoccus peritrichatus]|uniref:Nucleoside phosphorylase domain-containing protein n=1 Tax=Rubellicoccus peritrichatus TaxID=3080537 RepID=A0AAQ3LD81_9BACT|nr:hypothetical protein [Puniceicoccus sp. CR14]WOO43331.1 hypothetical protein RZN69_09535 [Puniceicoccus sp. CR14]